MSKPKRSIAHVCPEPGPGKKWVVYWYPADDPESPGVDVYPKKAEAVREAVDWAKRYPPSQVFIHTKDGKIADERTYGSDPNPPAGVRRRK